MHISLFVTFLMIVYLYIAGAYFICLHNPQNENISSNRTLDLHSSFPKEKVCCSIPDAPTLKARSSRPTPVLPADQSPLCTTNPRPIPDATTLTTLNIGPTLDLISTPGLKWIIQANVMPGSVPKLHTWPILLIKSDLKWCIHLSRLTICCAQYWCNI